MQKTHSSSRQWLVMLTAVVAILMLIAALAAPLVQVQAAPDAITEFVAGMTASGTAPFNTTGTTTCTPNGTTYTPGDDACGADNIIRTHDYANYRVGFTLTPQDTNALLTLEMGAHTLPGAYVGPLSATDPVAYFDVADLPTGANGCQNISASPVSDPPPAGTSGVTADGQKLFCYQPTPVSGNNQDFRVTINGDAPNGTTLAAPTITFESDNNGANSSPTALSGTVGSETFYGLDDLIVSAAPRWNVEKNHFYGASYRLDTGPNGEDGFIFPFQLGIYATGSRKGLEALANPTVITDDFNDPDFPNMQVVTWDMSANNAAYDDSNYSATASATGPLALNGCADWRSVQGALGTPDNGFYRVNDRGLEENATVPFRVARGGTCDITAWDNSAKTASFELDQTDFSLSFYPTREGSNPAGPILVDPVNPDSSTNEWWAASKLILFWAPPTDVSPDLQTAAQKFFTNEVNLVATSVTGQANVEPTTADNAFTEGANFRVSGSFAKTNYKGTFNNPFGLAFAPRDPNVTGSSYINYAAPNQIVEYQVGLTNNGTSAFPAGLICDKFDNTRLTLLDTTDPAYVVTASWGEKDPATGIGFLVRDPNGVVTAIELGVGGTGITAAGTWATMDTTTSPYDAPSKTGSAQGDSDCDDADATWFASVADLTAAGFGMEDVTRIRLKYSQLDPTYGVGLRLLAQVNETYAFSGTDNAPGSAFTAGDSTIGDISPNQALWEPNIAGYNENGVRTSQAIQIFQTEYAQISKSSPTNPDSTLVPVGTQVTYDLVVNLSTTGSAHTSDVTVWDVLPAYMSYVPGSSAYGGVALGDPVCAVGAWPAGAPTGTPAGTIEPGYQACYWTLDDQAVIKTQSGQSVANLPTLEFRAVVDVAAPNGTQLLNTSFADSTDNLKPDATYQGGLTGFKCETGQNCSYSDWLLEVASTPGIVLQKTVDQALVPTEIGFNYGLIYGAIGNSLSGTRILDVLPYTGDGRTPESDYTGTLALTGPIAAPVASAGPPATLADPSIVILYTSNAYADINTDPYDAGHDLTGGGANSATTTNWCTVAQIGGANCPASWADVTGFMALPLNGAAMLPGDLYQLTVPVQPTGNAREDIYSNSFIGDSPDLTARRPGSNIVTTTVVQPDLVLDKSVSPTSLVRGEDLVYTLVASNNTGDGIGPIYAAPAPAITVNDTLPAGIEFSAASDISGASWDCSASSPPSTVNCTYTGALPLGVGATVGGPIEIDAQIVTGATAGDVTNNACVAMTGQIEDPTDNNCDSVTVTIRQINLSGNVFHDTDGLDNGTVDGTGINQPNGDPLYASLVDPASGNVVAVTPIAADGSYEFLDVTPNTTYQVVLSTTAGNVGSSAPAPNLPNGWINTGENVGAFAGDDGSPDGLLTVAVATSDVVEVNFGITSAAIGNQVWIEEIGNENSAFDANDTVVPGVTLELVNASNGTVVDTVTTLPNGQYYFLNVPAGEYFVRIPASEFESGGPLNDSVTEASIAGFNADPNTDTGDNDDDGYPDGSGAVITNAFTFDGLTSRFDIDFGFLASGSSQTALSLSGSGVGLANSWQVMLLVLVLSGLALATLAMLARRKGTRA